MEWLQHDCYRPRNASKALPLIYSPQPLCDDPARRFATRRRLRCLIEAAYTFVNNIAKVFGA